MWLSILYIRRHTLSYTPQWGLLSQSKQTIRCVVVVYTLLFQLLTHLNPSLTWNVTESYLFVMTAIAGNMEP